MKGVVVIDLRVGSVGVFGFFFVIVIVVKDLRVIGVFGFFLLIVVSEMIGLKILGDFNLSFFLFVVVDVVMAIFVCLFLGWKIGFVIGELNVKVVDLLRFSVVGLNVILVGLFWFFLVVLVDC